MISSAATRGVGDTPLKTASHSWTPYRAREYKIALRACEWGVKSGRRAAASYCPIFAGYTPPLCKCLRGYIGAGRREGAPWHGWGVLPLPSERAAVCIPIPEETEKARCCLIFSVSAFALHRFAIEELFILKLSGRIPSPADFKLNICSFR